MKNILLVFYCCCILFSCSLKKETEEITYSNTIADIIYTNCTPCHRQGAAGPFSLITYNDVLKKSKTIVKVTASRYMPPWPADPAYTHFTGERILAQEDIDKLKIWVDNGCPLGDSINIPKPPVFPTGSMLGEPDLVIHFPDTVHLKGDNKDHFFLAKVPYILSDSILSNSSCRIVKAIEFVPGNKKYLHHMNANLINYGEGQKKNVFGGEKYVPTDLAQDAMSLQQKMDNLNDDGTIPINLVRNVSNYLPGVTPSVYPPGIGGFEICRTGSFFINDLHYGPNAVDTFDAGSYFNIFFTDVPIKRLTYDVVIGSLSKMAPVEPALVIPANEVRTFYARWKTERDFSVLTVNPHMHLIGKDFLAYALTPANDTIRLVHIPKWNFRWQYFYTFKNPVKIPAGSTIVVEGTYDNTAANPNNPHDPPQVIVDRANPLESMRTTDEMLQLILTLMPYEEGDEKIDLEHVPLK